VKIYQSSALTLAVLLLSLHIQVSAQHNQRLIRSSPEEQGVSSAAIIRLLDATTKSKTEFQSFMLLRHEKVIAEGCFINRYYPDKNQQ